MYYNTCPSVRWTNATVVQLVVRHLAKVEVAGSSPVCRFLIESVSERIPGVGSRFFYTIGNFISYRIKKDAPLRMRTRAKSRVLPGIFPAIFAVKKPENLSEQHKNHSIFPE